jgi:hypothetical protein
MPASSTPWMRRLGAVPKAGPPTFEQRARSVCGAKHPRQGKLGAKLLARRFRDDA